VIPPPTVPEAQPEWLWQIKRNEVRYNGAVQWCDGGVRIRDSEEEKEGKEI